MTTATKNTEIFQRVVFPVSINMVNLNVDIFLMAAYASMRKIFQSIFFVICISILIAIMFFAFESCESNGIFFRKPFILTFFATTSSMLCLRFYEKCFFSAVFADNRNFIFCVPFMETHKRAKKTKSLFFYNKINRTIFTFCNLFRMPIFLTTTYTAKLFSFLISCKMFIAKFTNFIHSQRIYHLIINDQVKV